MAFVVKDRVKETTTTTGTSDLVLSGSVSGFQSFSNALADGDTTYYAIFEVSTNEWEVGVGTWTESTTTLARTTVLASSNSGSKVSLTAQAEVFISQPAGKAAFFDPSGDLTLVQDPTSNLQAATKQYVDTIAAAGLHYHDPVRVEQEGNLSATYSNGTAGVGATLTNNSTQAALTIDGVALSLNDRVLIYEQTNGYENGIYTVTNVGSASTNWVLTRATDADSYGPSDPDSLGQGDAFFVLEGTAGAGELYVMNTEGSITFGTTNITFTQVAATAVYTAGTGLTLTGTEFAAAQDISTSASPSFAGITVGDGHTIGDDVGDNFTLTSSTGENIIYNSAAGTHAFKSNGTSTVTFDGSGNITVTGTVDGRDIAADGSKLDGIETGATADQTKADIDALGINATTLDSLDSTQFLRSDANDTATGELTFNAKLDIANGTYLGWGGGTGRPSIGGDKTTGELELWAGGTKTVSVDNTGIDVTGTVTADGLTVDGDAKFTDISPAIILSENDTTNVNTRLGNYGGDFSITTVNDSDVYVANRLTVDHSTGDISFYDTSGNAKFFWDASAESLGIGTSSPSNSLEISNNTAYAGLTVSGSAAPAVIFNDTTDAAFARVSGNNTGRLILEADPNNDAAGTSIEFEVDGSEAARIDSSGNLLVGTTVNDGQSIGAGSQDGIVLAEVSQYIQRGDNANLWLSKPSGATSNEFIKFYNNSSLVGQIECSGTTLEIMAQSTNFHLQTNGGTSNASNNLWSQANIKPWNNNYFDLGVSNYRWKDLYLAGSLSDGTTSRTVADIVGLTSSQFLRSDADDTATGKIVFGSPISAGSSAKIQVGGFQRTGPIMLAQGTTSTTSFNTTNERWLMNNGTDLYASTSSSSYNNKIWTDGNDGSGSGLDADTVDGIQASSFLRSDANDTATGAITFSPTGATGQTYFGSSTQTSYMNLVIYSNSGSGQIWKSGTGFTSYGGASALNIYNSNANIAFFSNARTTADMNITNGDVSVSGTLSATTKSFVIDHPTKEGMKLRHGSLEGPEDGVYVRGRLTGETVIELPDYWTGLVHEDSITVQLTAMGGKADLWVESIADNKVTVGCDTEVDCFYFVQATRKDVDAWDVEYVTDS